MGSDGKRAEEGIEKRRIDEEGKGHDRRVHMSGTSGDYKISGLVWNIS